MTPTEPDLDALVVAPTNPGQSLLFHLGDRRQSILQEQVLDLRVPRWSNPSIWVRYQPVDFSVADKARRMAGNPKSKGEAQSEAILLANVDALIAGCIGVYAQLDDDNEHRQFSLRPGDPEGSLTTFDGDLAQNLGLNGQATARQVVRTLFLTDGDILYHGTEVAKFSGYAGEEADSQLGE